MAVSKSSTFWVVDTCIRKLLFQMVTLSPKSGALSREKLFYQTLHVSPVSPKTALSPLKTKWPPTLDILPKWEQKKRNNTYHPRGHTATQHLLCSAFHLCTTGSSVCHVVWELSTVTPSTSWMSRMDGAASSFNLEFYSTATFMEWHELLYRRRHVSVSWIGSGLVTVFPSLN